VMTYPPVDMLGLGEEGTSIHRMNYKQSTNINPYPLLLLHQHQLLIQLHCSSNNLPTISIHL
jgi:hypothetical protein